MKILVTGHLGTIGRPLVKKLRSQGHEVVGVDIRHSDDGIRADVAEYRQIARVPDVELVYHLAGEFGRHNGEDYTEQLWRTNVIGTKNMLRLQKERGFRMVFASSSEVYGDRGDVVLREDMPPIYLHNDYAISKQVNEAQIANASGETMIVRICNLYGPGEFYHAYRSVVCLFLYGALRKLPYTVYANYYRAFQYIGDFIESFAACATRFSKETVNLASDDYRSVESLHRVVVDTTGVNVGQYADVDPNNVVLKRISIDRARAILGHAPSVKLEEGVRRTWDWMCQAYQ